MFSIYLQKAEQTSHDTSGAQFTGYLIAVKAINLPCAAPEKTLQDVRTCLQVELGSFQMAVCPNVIVPILWKCLD